MDKDDFLDALKEQYAEEILQACLECCDAEQVSVDIETLNELLNQLMESALTEGLQDIDFEKLVEDILQEFRPELADYIKLAC